MDKAGSCFTSTSQSDCQAQNSLLITVPPKRICHRGCWCKLSCCNRSETSIRLVAGVRSLPADHVGGQGGMARSCEELLRALPHAHGQTPSKEHVEQVLHFVRDLKAKAFTDYYVPRAAELLVHGLLDHLCCALEETPRTEQINKKKQDGNLI